MLKVKKSKPILICAILMVLCAMGSLAAAAVNHIENNENQSATVIAANEVCAMDNVQEVKHKGDIMFGTYERKEAELNGECSANANRITVEEVEEMIHDGMDYGMIESKLAEIQPFADFIGGSGVTMIEYWLDETGNDKILLIREQENIIHVVDFSDDSEDLYDVLM
jgi:hypothetical protein